MPRATQFILWKGVPDYLWSDARFLILTVIRLMKLHLEKIQAYSVIFIEEDRIDAHNSAELKDYILHLLEQGELHLIVQLADVRFIDSSGLGALLSGYKHAAAKSGKLVLACCSQQVAAMFELTRLNRAFEMYADLNEALASTA